MAKAANRKLSTSRIHHDQLGRRKRHKVDKTQPKDVTPKMKKEHKQKHPSTIPFDVFDKILLVGEGDLSFTLSLLHDHGCANLTATTYDSEQALHEKYPHAEDAIKQIREEDQTVLHGIDAQKLSTYKELKKRAPFDRIIFNFPHVGGVSTDVNRQVRANQALLSSFFKSALSILSDPNGTILVTLFESEPYTLWNVRDLARNAGLVVLRSWKFERDVYPLYKHARTIGVVKNKAGEVSESAWKGEERPARTYEFGLKGGEGITASMGVGGRTKRKGNEDDDSDDYDD